MFQYQFNMNIKSNIKLFKYTLIYSVLLTNVTIKQFKTNILNLLIFSYCLNLFKHLLEYIQSVITVKIIRICE